MPIFSDEQLTVAMERLPAWQSVSHKIQREYRFATFAAAIAFVNHLAAIAESADHHPDLDIRYNRVTLALTTHDESGVTKKDIDLASRLDAAGTQF